MVFLVDLKHLQVFAFDLLVRGVILVLLVFIWLNFKLCQVIDDARRRFSCLGVSLAIRLDFRFFFHCIFRELKGL